MEKSQKNLFYFRRKKINSKYVLVKIKGFAGAKNRGNSWLIFRRK